VGNSAGSGAARKNCLLGGTYDFGVVKVHGLVQKSTGPASLDVLDIMAGVTVPVAGGNLMASYIHHNDRTSADKDANQLGIGYLYPLSKRTAVYTAFGRIEDQHGATFTVGNATEAGTGTKAFNLGVVHNF
jgi:predicted porin